MNKTPVSNRTHISIYGKRNAGKSSLMNAIIGQDIAIVSDVKGTTTDPVKKTMELLPHGPVVFIDTAGLDDKGKLGKLRVESSMKILQRTDFGIYLVDSTDVDKKSIEEFKENFNKLNIPHLVVFNKTDLISDKKLNNLKSKYPKSEFISTNNLKDVIDLKQRLIKELKDNKDETIVGDLLDYGSKVIMVVPIDSEAPKGRIILPQVQMIRDCLDHGIKSYVVRDTELESSLKDLDDIDLVITDSQAFKRVDKIVPDNIKLTSFSILFARFKGGKLDAFLDGIKAIDKLDKNSNVLISESCTHNFSHEDIGRVKIPNWFESYKGHKINFDFKMGHDFPTELEKYDLVIHCGACMVNPKTVKTRIQLCNEKNIPITNYGLIIAYFTNILDRSIEVFDKNEKISSKIN